MLIKKRSLKRERESKDSAGGGKKQKTKHQPILVNVLKT